MTDDERAAAKSRLALIKGVQAGVQNAEIAEATKAATTSTQDLVVQVVQSMIKKGTQAAAEYESAGRADLAAKEQQEVEWLREYLPPQLAPEELAAMASDLVASMGATSKKDMGRVMGAMKDKVGSAATGADVAKAVTQAIDNAASA